MEDLDRLLLGANNNAGRQFHEGDDRTALVKNNDNNKNGNNNNENKENYNENDYNSPQVVNNISNTIKEKYSTREDDDDYDFFGSTEQKQQQQLSSSSSSALWSLKPRIFAIEKGNNGKRKYLVGEFGRIADWYWRKTVPKSRHLYEVIREDTPCRLYLDLEFNRKHNPSVPVIRLLRELEDELATELDLHYRTILPQSRFRSSQIVNLDSSNGNKFSRHWIVHLPVINDDEDTDDIKDDTYDNDDNYHSDDDDGDQEIKLRLRQNDQRRQRQEFLFKDAPTVGRFIKRMVGRLADDIATDENFAKKRPALAKYLFINTKNPNKQSCFIDLGVYTRNRLFRCLGSSKRGKNTTLEAVLDESAEEEEETEDSKRTAEEGHDDEGESSNNTPQGDDVGGGAGGTRYYFPLTMPNKMDIEQESAPSPLSSASNVTSSMDTFIVANDWEPHAQALADSLVVPLKNSVSSFLSNNDSSLSFTNSNTTDDTANNSNRILEVANTNYRTDDKYNNQSGYHHRPPTPTSMKCRGSPLPSLDRYVLQNLANRGGVRGSIRVWSIEYGGPRGETPVSFTYQIQRNRWCEMIGRSHKSNNVFWTVYLDSWTCVQGCWDRECMGR